ncbi:MAG TPA: YaiI/YqxD family protein [Candidatus Polarisedimenticolia bacterium]|nr:YaiI/YqxD family protein [Candidatus Polarisedimenticolia bacterium]
MRIWIDADACPQAVREIVFRAAVRLEIPVLFVSNRGGVPKRSAWITAVQVSKDLDAADRHIAEQAVAEDLVITADIPLAAKVVEKGAVAIDPRGETYTAENVGERLSVRDFLQSLRAEGQITGGPGPFSNADRQRFANALDRQLARRRPGQRIEGESKP